jgi:hypothetical protein
MTFSGLNLAPSGANSFSLAKTTGLNLEVQFSLCVIVVVVVRIQVPVHFDRTKTVEILNLDTVNLKLLYSKSKKFTKLNY